MPSELRMQIMGVNVFVDNEASPNFCRISVGGRSVICSTDIEILIRTAFDAGLRALGQGLWDSALRIELPASHTELVLRRGDASLTTREAIEDSFFFGRNVRVVSRVRKKKKKRVPEPKLVTKPKGRKIVLDNGA